MQDHASPRVSILSPQDLDETFIDRWTVLERHAFESNAFLSPNFILPALQHLTPNSPVRILAIDDGINGEESLVGLGVFEENSGSAALPLPHLRAYNSIHSFMDGLLVESRSARRVIEAFFRFLQTEQDLWHGVHFGQCRADSDQANLMTEVASQAGGSVQTIREWERAVIVPAEIPADYMTELYSPTRRKSFRRAQNKLSRKGPLSFHAYRCGEDHDARCQTFLELEAMGWKGRENSALLSNENEANFFWGMSRAFAASGRAVFIELRVGDTPVFASSNYLSGNECFGFKSGWHTDYQACSPGRQGELMTLAHAPAQLADVTVMDSCSEPGQYIDHIWPWRRRMASRVFTATRVAEHASTITSTLLRLKHRLTGNGA